MNLPTDLKYTESHEWIRREDDGSFTLGITAHAQEALGEIVYLELPDVGDEVEQGEDFGVVESVKAASDLFSPLPGEVVAVNESLEEDKDAINTDPYHAGWIIRVSASDEANAMYDELMDAAAYDAFLHK